MNRRQKFRKGLILFSFFLFPAVYYYLSPVLIIQASAQGIINGSFLVFCLLFLGSLLFGRGYCGWVCPGAGCQEAIFMAQNKKITKGDLVKWFIWIPWIGAIIALATKAGGYRQVEFFYQTTRGFSIANLQALIAYLFILFVLIVFPAFIFGRRSFCHHLCWMAPFMIIGRAIRNIGKWPSLRLLAQKEKCLHCHTCTENCPMSLPVERMVNSHKMENAECILCGTCADGCHKSAITMVFR
jgi:ferredoxin-type protein NapH